MIYSDFKISNFRGIKDLHLKDLGRVNLLLGKNNCGKTSALEALFLTTGMSIPDLAVRIDNFRGIVHDDPDDFLFIFYGLDYANEPTFEATFDNKTTRSLVVRPTLKTGARDNSKIDSSTKSDTGLKADGLVFEFSSKGYHAAKESQKATVKFVDGQMQGTPARNYKEQLNGVFVPSSSGSATTGDLAARLEKILVEKRRGDLIDVLQSIDPNIKDIMIGRKNMIYVDIGFASYVPLNVVGGGLYRLLGILVNLYYNKGSILFIDEIENGLHYGALSKAWRAIIQATKRFDIQLFVTTHNMESLQQLKNTLDSLNAEIFDSYRDEVTAFTLVKQQDNHIEAVRHSYSQFQHAIEAGIDLR